MKPNRILVKQPCLQMDFENILYVINQDFILFILLTPNHRAFTQKKYIKTDCFLKLLNWFIL